MMEIPNEKVYLHPESGDGKRLAMVVVLLRDGGVTQVGVLASEGESIDSVAKRISSCIDEARLDAVQVMSRAEFKKMAG